MKACPMFHGRGVGGEGVGMFVHNEAILEKTDIMTSHTR